MQKELVKEQLSAFEERLELLEYQGEIPKAFLRELQGRFQNLTQSIGEELLRQKGLHARDLIQRISRQIFETAAQNSYDICVSYRGTGFVSMAMVESSMGAILSAVASCFDSYQTYTRAKRMRDKLFRPYSFHLEIHGDRNQICFKVYCDGQNEFETDHIRAVRQHVAKHGGWFRKSSFKSYGSSVEFKIPLAQQRPSCMILRFGNLSVAIPDTYKIDEKSQESYAGEPVWKLHPEKGFIPCKQTAAKCLRVGVADFSFLLGFDEVSENIKVRIIKDEDLLAPDSWFHSFGVVQQDSHSDLVPFLDGHTLLEFYKKANA